MGIKTGIGLGVLAAVGVGLGGFGTYMGIMNQPAKAVTGETSEVSLETVAGYTTDTEAGDIAVGLSHVMDGGNTLVVWHCGKMLAGQRHDFEGTWSDISGGATYHPETETLKAVEVRFLLDSFTGYGSEHPAQPALTNTLRNEAGWFQVKENPEAVFTCSDIAKNDSQADATHTLNGQFQLNGVTQALAIPATIVFDGDVMTLDAAFEINRIEYKVDGSGVPGSEVDEVVGLEVHLEVKPDAGFALDALNETIAKQAVQIVAQRELIDRLTRGQLAMQETLANLERQLAQIAANGGGTGTPAIDVDSLPARFTDSFDFTLRIETKIEGEVDEDGNDVFSVSFSEQPVSEFDMILVPGDPEKGIAPFYMSETEVPWNRLEYWAFCRDIDTDTSVADIERGLRPTPLFGNTEQTKIGFGPLPAIGLSRLTAEAYCKWLSLETGRQYRLPTAEEWEHAVVLGGGIPTDRDALLAHAVLLDNAPIHNDIFCEMPKPVGSTTPNALGIYDLLGSAAEWVTGTGADRVVRGGHFLTSADELTLDWQAVEDQNVWNANYPNDPKSLYWYKDHYYQGIRLVCEPVNLPAE